MIYFSTLRSPEDISSFLPEPSSVIYAEMDEMAVTTSNSQAHTLYTPRLINCTGIGMHFNCKTSDIRGGALMHLKVSHMYMQYGETGVRERVKQAWDQMQRLVTGIVNPDDPQMKVALTGSGLTNARHLASPPSQELRAESYDIWQTLQDAHIKFAEELNANERRKATPNSKSETYREVVTDFRSNYGDILQRIQSPEIDITIANITDEVVEIIADEIGRIIETAPLTKDAVIIDNRNNSVTPCSLIVHSRSRGNAPFTILDERERTLKFNALNSGQWNRATPLQLRGTEAKQNTAQRILHRIHNKYAPQ